MEASQAGQAAQGDNGAAESGPQYVTSEQFNQAMTQNAEQLREMLPQVLQEYLPQQQQGQEGEPEAEPDFDLSFLEDSGYDPAETAERLAQGFDQRMEQAIKQATEPLQQQIQEQQYAREAEALVAEIPELAEPEVQQEVLGLARDMIDNNGWPQDLLHDPKFWRVAYFARQTANAANQEGSEQPSAAHLEGGGGATPASAQVDHAQLIVDAGRGGRSALPF